MTSPRRIAHIARRPAALAALVLAFLGVWASPAAAHASLVSTDPPNGALLDEPVEEVVLTFNEPVSPRAIAVIDESGTRTDHDLGRSAELTVPVDTAAGGWFAVSWRVISADGHPVAGAITFRVGAGADVAPDSLRDAAAASEARSRSEDGRSAARAISLVALVVVVGSAFVRRSALADSLETVRRLALIAATVAAAGAAGALAFSALGDAMTTASTVGDAAPLAALVAPLLWRRHDTPRRAEAVGAAGVIGLALTSFAGHTHADGGVLTRVALIAHLVAAAVWLGATPALVLALRAGAGWTVVARFSRAATVALAVVAVGGSATAWLLAGDLDTLTGSTWGRFLIVKVVLVIAAAVVGAANRKMLRGRSKLDLVRRLVALEAVLLIATLGATGLMTRHAPTADAAAEDTSALTVPAGPLDVEILLGDPMGGTRTLHVTVYEDGQQTEVESLTLGFANTQLGLEPVTQRLTRAGVGHFIGETDDLRFDGTWTAHLTVRVDRFAEHSGRADFPVDAGRR